MRTKARLSHNYPLRAIFNFNILCKTALFIPCTYIVVFIIVTYLNALTVVFEYAEAESELVAGFFTEHSSIIFVFFFLSEYSSIVLMSSLTAILFFGGYNFIELFENNTVLNLQSIILGIKTCLFCFLFV